MKLQFNPFTGQFELAHNQAGQIAILDEHNHYHAKNVEGALQEIAEGRFNFKNTSLYDLRYLMDAPADGNTYGRKNNAWEAVTSGGGGTWGSITGTLSDQIDLNTTLNARLVAASNLSDLANATTARTNLGLVAGGAGDIWVEKAGDTMTGDLTFQTGKAALFYDTSDTRGITMGMPFNSAGSSSSYFRVQSTVAGQGAGFMLLPEATSTNGASFFIYGGYADASNYKYMQIYLTKSGAVGFTQAAAGGGYSTGNWQWTHGHGSRTYLIHNSTTNNLAYDILKIENRYAVGTSGAANGMGAGISLYSETATNATYQQQALIMASWIDATNASRKAKLSLSAYDTAARLGLEIEADGSAAKIGLFGVTPVARPTTAGTASTFTANTSGIADDSATFDGYTIGQVVKALRNLGILT